MQNVVIFFYPTKFSDLKIMEFKPPVIKRIGKSSPFESQSFIFTPTGWKILSGRWEGGVPMLKGHCSWRWTWRCHTGDYERKNSVRPTTSRWLFGQFAWFLDPFRNKNPKILWKKYKKRHKGSSFQGLKMVFAFLKKNKDRQTDRQAGTYLKKGIGLVYKKLRLRSQPYKSKNIL